MRALKSTIHTITTFAPASCANVAVGFDILGFAFSDVGDKVSLSRRQDKQIVITNIEGNVDIPKISTQNVASVVVAAVCDDLQLECGFDIAIKKGIPLGSGMGGSAASTIAALVAINGFLEEPLTNTQLIHYALLGEQVATGHRHYDNIVACLLGGLVLVHSVEPFDVIALPIPDIHCVIVHPHYRLDTRLARQVLSNTLSLKDYVKQSAHLAAFIASLYHKDTALLQRSLHDLLIEPYRAALVPGFYQVKQAALDAEALGSGLSGSGPSLFAFAQNRKQAEKIRDAMCAAFVKENLATDSWVTRISEAGASIVGVE